MERLFNPPRKPYLAAWNWTHNVEENQNRSSDDLTEHLSRPEGGAMYCAALCGFSRLVSYLILTHAEVVSAKWGRHGTPLRE